MPSSASTTTTNCYLRSVFALLKIVRTNIMEFFLILQVSTTLYSPDCCFIELVIRATTRDLPPVSRFLLNRSRICVRDDSYEEDEDIVL